MYNILIVKYFSVEENIMTRKTKTIKSKITLLTILISGLGMLVIAVTAAISIFELSKKMRRTLCWRSQRLPLKESHGK